MSGLLALQSGHGAEAVDRIRRATSAQPRNWMFQANLASALLQVNEHEDARQAFRAAVKLNPDDPQLQVGAANCLALRGDFAAAEQELRKVVRRFPGAASAWFNLGNTVRDQGRLDEAVKLFSRATQLDSNNADAFNNLGSALHSLERFSDAEAAYRKAIALRPDEVLAYGNLASVLIDAGRFEEAEGPCREALRIDPRSVNAHSALAAALSSQGRLAEALPFYREVAALSPDDLRHDVALGSTLFDAGDTAEGIALLERVAKMEPESAGAHQALAWAYLGVGDLQAGWREYYYRPGRDRFVAKHATITLTPGLPADLKGSTVCLLREQGLGDELFFARYVRRLRERGASVLYSADPRLADMLRRTGLFERVVSQSEAVPAADFHVLAGDLPLALAVNDPGPATNALPTPLELTPLPGVVEAVRTKLEALGPPPYIGLTWRAGIAPEQHRGATWAFFKHVSLAGVARALQNVRGTVLVLQRGLREGELDELTRHLGRPAHDLSEMNNDLEAMLATLGLIDDYVGVSNTNMHLRAGTGKAARVLVPCPAEWRWLLRGDVPVWFPGFRTYRQQGNGDWDAALGTLQADLQRTYGCD